MLVKYGTANELVGVSNPRGEIRGTKGASRNDFKNGITKARKYENTKKKDRESE